MKDKGWHKKVREETIRKLKQKNREIYTSHAGIANLNLYRGEKIRANCLSDTDIVVFDNNKITHIIEVESTVQPKHIIGDILATHLCDNCVIHKKGKFPLKNIHLKIIYKKAKPGSKKTMKMVVIEKPLKEAIKKIKGCLSSFEFEEHK